MGPYVSGPGSGVGLGPPERLLSFLAVKRFLPLLLVALFVLPGLALGQADNGERLDIIDISGPLDNEAISFVYDTLESVADRGTEVVVIGINSPGVVADAEEFERLKALIASPPVPVAVWIGPAPAVAYGGAVDLLASAQIKLAAPGVKIGLTEPTLVADGNDESTSLPTELADAFVEVEGPIPGVVDDVVPAIRQLIPMLDGMEVETASGVRQLSTMRAPDAQGELESITPVFHKPGWWSRFLRLAVTPEAAFMFLVAGLAVAAFEFYAVGPGIAAAVAAASLFLAAYGIFALPLRWWAVALAVVGWWIMTDSYQRGSVAVLTGLGAVSMAVGGLWFVDGAPQLKMNPAATLVIVAIVTLFYAVAMPTVARSRFSTRTIGRDYLVGSRGTALTDFDPDGEVEVDGARWRAAAHREAGILAGDSVRIAEVDGLVLEVEAID